jgi:hypothetical protein
MLQLQMAWILDLRSLKQDAIISILGAVVSLGTLVRCAASKAPASSLVAPKAPALGVPALRGRGVAASVLQLRGLTAQHLFAHWMLTTSCAVPALHDARVLPPAHRLLADGRCEARARSCRR